MTFRKQALRGVRVLLVPEVAVYSCMEYLVHVCQVLNLDLLSSIRWLLNLLYLYHALVTKFI
eukprot:SAG31_NODE_18983_length_615_cov_1.563953_1_plen_61_part_10